VGTDLRSDTNDLGLQIGLARLTAAVDSHGNHELRVLAPQADLVANNGCAPPDAWTLSDDGPVLLQHSILIPDKLFAAGKAFTRYVSLPFQMHCYTFLGGTCHEHGKWTASIHFSPQPRFDLGSMHFDGPAPIQLPSTGYGLGSRG